MKRLITFCALLLLSATAISQRIDSVALSRITDAQRNEVANLAAEERKYNGNGFALVGAGSALIIGGFIQMVVALNNDIIFDGKEPNLTPGVVLATVGGTLAICSISQFRKAHKIGREIKAIVFERPGVSMSNGVTLPRTGFAGFGLQVSLGR